MSRPTTPGEPFKPVDPTVAPGTVTPPVETVEPLPAGVTTGTGSTDTKTVAKEQAGQVAQQAGQEGKRVAAEAKAQAGEVVGEARRQAKDLTRQATSVLSEQAGQQTQRAATGVRTLSDDLRAMASGSTPSEGGIAADLTHQLSGQLGQVAQWLENREPADLLDDVRRFARRRPGAFLLAAGAAGLLAGRLTRGVRDVKADDDDEQYRYAQYSRPAYGQTYAEPVGVHRTSYAEPTYGYAERDVVAPLDQTGGRHLDGGQAGIDPLTGLPRTDRA